MFQHLALYQGTPKACFPCNTRYIAYLGVLLYEFKSLGPSYKTFPGYLPTHIRKISDYVLYISFFHANHTSNNSLVDALATTIF